MKIIRVIVILRAPLVRMVRYHKNGGRKSVAGHLYRRLFFNSASIIHSKHYKVFHRMFFINCSPIVHAVLAGSVSALVFFWGHPAQAAPVGDTENTSTVMMVAESSEKEAFSPLISAVRAQLSDFPVVFRVKWVENFPAELPAQEEFSVSISEESGASMVFWCDFTRTDRMYLYLAIPELARVVVRRLDSSGVGFTAETLGIMVRNLVDAVLKGAVDSIQPYIPEEEQPKVPANTPAEEQPSSDSSAAEMDKSDEKPKNSGATQTLTGNVNEESTSRTEQNRVYAQVGYALDILSTSHLATHGVSFVLDVYLVKNWHLFAGYTAAVAIQAKVEGFEMALSRHPVMLGSRYGILLGRVELGGGLFCSLDYTKEKIRSVDGPFSAKTEGGEFIVSLVPFFHSSVRIYSTLFLYLNVGIDVPFNRPNYVINSKSENGSTSIFSTWAVRPIGRLGLMMGFL